MPHHIIEEECTGCGVCFEECEDEAIFEKGDVYQIDPEKCTDCGTCMEVCTADAVEELEESEK